MSERDAPVARAADLQRLIDALDQGLLARPRSRETFQASRKAIAALNSPSARTDARNPVDKPQRLAVCSELAQALAEPSLAAAPLAELAAAFMAIEQRLSWTRRQTADPADQRFYHGHANAAIAGPQGLEIREDVWFGVTLMAPRVLYPVHQHPPEEVYLALSQGEWWNAGMDWTAPGPGGTIYNSPGIAHAMRSGEKPMLAFWVLPLQAV